MLVVEEVRLTKDALRYGYAVGKVKVLETKTLDSAAYERLLDAPTFAEQKRLLSESPYGRFLENAHTPEAVERALDEALEHFYGFLEEAALPAPVARFFRLRYDFANLKAVTKARLLGASVEGLLIDHGTVPIEAFAGDLEKLPEPLASTAASLPLDEEDEMESEVEHAEAGGAAVDTLIDKAMFSELQKTAKQSKSAFLVDLARLAIDLANAKTLLRANRAGHSAEGVKAMLIDGGSVPAEKLAALAEADAPALGVALERIPVLRTLAGTALLQDSALDASLDEVNVAALRKGRMGQVGPEPVIAYVFEREYEVAALRVLLLGRLTGIDTETLRRHVSARR